MKKRLVAVLLVLLLAISPAAVWAADSNANELLWLAESLAEDVLASDQETIDAMIEKVLPEGMTKEQAAEYLRLTAQVVTSQEFQDLLAHVEVQDLLKEVIKRAAALTKEDPEMVKEILRTLGIKEGVIEVLALAYDHMDVLTAIAEEYLESEEGQQLLGVLEQLKDDVNYQELVKGLVEVMETDSPALPESTAESPEGETEPAAGQG